MRVTVVHNPSAGDESHTAEAICSLIERSGHGVSYHAADGAEWKSALEEPTELVAVAGGDGTVQKVMRELATKPLPLTLLPLGSANNIASSLGLAEQSLDDLVIGWSRGGTRRYDIGEVSAPGLHACFLESLGGGLFAAALERAHAEDDHGDKVELGLRLLRELIEAHIPVRWQLELDGVDHSGDFLAVEATIGGRTGPGMPIAPRADPGDCLLDVVRIGNGDRPELASYLDARLAGADPMPPRLQVQRVRELTVSHPVEHPFRIDDDSWPAGSWPTGDEAILVTTGTYAVEVLVPG